MYACMCCGPVAAAKVLLFLQGKKADECDAATTLMWRELAKASSLISSFERLAELILVMVPGNVEEERTFATMGFIKSKLSNSLGEPPNGCGAHEAGGV